MQFELRHLIFGLATIALVAVFVVFVPAGRVVRQVPGRVGRGALNWLSDGTDRRYEVVWGQPPPVASLSAWQGAPVYYRDGSSFRWAGYVRVRSSGGDTQGSSQLELILATGSVTGHRKLVAYAYAGLVPLDRLSEWLLSDPEVLAALKQGLSQVTEQAWGELPALMARHGQPVLEVVMATLEASLSRRADELRAIAAEFAAAVAQEVARDERTRQQLKAVLQERLEPVMLEVANQISVRNVLVDVLRRAVSRIRGEELLESLQRIAAGTWVPNREDLVAAMVKEVSRVIDEPATVRQLEEAFAGIARAVTTDRRLQQVIGRVFRRKMGEFLPRLRAIVEEACLDVAHSRQLRQVVAEQLNSPAFQTDLMALVKRLRTPIRDQLKMALFDRRGHIRPAVAFVLKVTAVRHGERFVLLEPVEERDRGATSTTVAEGF